ncbi:MAG: prepilin peptidase [Sneathiellales bacterium]|nr:prepilin peptidase [Sneathiellales bacterium]
METILFQSWGASLAIGLLIYAALSDIKTRRIPNWLTLSLFFLFPVFAIFAEAEIEIFRHLFWGGCLLVLLFPLFMLEKMGGGDVKLIAVTALWCGPLSGIEFLLLTSFIGGALALYYISPVLQFSWEWVKHSLHLPEFSSPSAQASTLPYGVAIAIGGSHAIWAAYMG